MMQMSKITCGVEEGEGGQMTQPGFPLPVGKGWGGMGVSSSPDVQVMSPSVWCGDVSDADDESEGWDGGARGEGSDADDESEGLDGGARGEGSDADDESEGWDGGARGEGSDADDESEGWGGGATAFVGHKSGGVRREVSGCRYRCWPSP